MSGMSTETSKVLFRCNECEVGFDSRSEFMDHMFEAHAHKLGIVCPVKSCQSYIMYPTSVSRHLKEVHMDYEGADEFNRRMIPSCEVGRVSKRFEQPILQ